MITLGRVATVLVFVATFRSAVAATPAIRVYPSTPTLPVNVLRISLAFATAQPPHVLPRLTLQTDDGTAVGQAFLDQELWSPDARMLTLLFDPGRVKTGTIAHEQLGYALRPGATVWLLLDGAPITSWRIVGEQRVPPDPRAWRIASPAAGSRAALRIALRRPIDAMDRADLVVVDARGRAIDGVSSLSNGETSWSFVPRHAWQPGRYRLVVDPQLEDPEGNAIADAFEVRSGGAPAHLAQPLSLPFVISAP